MTFTGIRIKHHKVSQPTEWTGPIQVVMPMGDEVSPQPTESTNRRWPSLVANDAIDAVRKLTASYENSRSLTLDVRSLPAGRLWACGEPHNDARHDNG